MARAISVALTRSSSAPVERSPNTSCSAMRPPKSTRIFPSSSPCVMTKRSCVGTCSVYPSAAIPRGMIDIFLVSRVMSFEKCNHRTSGLSAEEIAARGIARRSCVRPSGRRTICAGWSRPASSRSRGLSSGDIAFPGAAAHRPTAGGCGDCSRGAESWSEPTQLGCQEGRRAGLASDGIESPLEDLRRPDVDEDDGGDEQQERQPRRRQAEGAGQRAEREQHGHAQTEDGRAHEAPAGPAAPEWPPAPHHEDDGRGGDDRLDEPTGSKRDRLGPEEKKQGAERQVVEDG